MKRHLKRLAVPKSWNIKRKKTTFVTRPKSSGHKKGLSTSLNMFMKEMAGIAKTTKEVKTIIQNQKVLVDGRQIKDHRFAVGFLDTIEVGNTDNIFRIILDNKGKLAYIVIDAKEAQKKICRIINKTMMKGKKIQLNLNDGKNYIIDDKTKYKVGDSLVIDLKNKKITEHLAFDNNMTVFLTEGNNKGTLGKITEIKENIITVKTNAGKEYKTRKNKGFIVGKTQPAVNIGVKND